MKEQLFHFFLRVNDIFENYQDFNGVKIALDHKKAKGNWNLNFTNVKIK